MRYIVVVYDPDEQTWYAPLVEAPGEDEALEAVGDLYSNCIPVCALNQEDAEHVVVVLRQGRPDLAWKDGGGIWLKQSA